MDPIVRWSLPVTAVFGLFTSAGVAPATAQSPSVSLSGGVTVVGQSTSDEDVDPEVVASLDLFAEARLGAGLLFAYVEGNTTPRAHGVSRLVGEANTDAGTALNRRRRGRVQLSELRIVWPFLGGSVTTHAGLLDATGFLDVSRIANDENLYFLGVPFVNNPTIEFPDYTLGAAVEGTHGEHRGLRYSAVVTSSHGLADNPGVSYAQLVDINEEAKGLFLGAAVRWKGTGGRASLGAWANTAEHPHLRAPGRTESSRGLFSVVGFFRGQHSLSARAGVANGSVSAARGFLGITYLWVRRPDAVGLAAGRTYASNADPTLKDVVHWEGFLRRRFVGDTFLTASLQRISDSGFGGAYGTVDRHLWVLGVRVSAQF